MLRAIRWIGRFDGFVDGQIRLAGMVSDLTAIFRLAVRRDAWWTDRALGKEWNNVVAQLFRVGDGHGPPVAAGNVATDLRHRPGRAGSSSKRSARFAIMAPPNSSASEMVTARR